MSRAGRLQDPEENRGSRWHLWSTGGGPAPPQGLCERVSHKITDGAPTMPFSDETPDSEGTAQAS